MQCRRPPPSCRSAGPDQDRRPSSRGWKWSSLPKPLSPPSSFPHPSTAFHRHRSSSKRHRRTSPAQFLTFGRVFLYLPFSQLPPSSSPISEHRPEPPIRQLVTSSRTSILTT
ncbi:UNVERIFIED_CONTAM: hypothetical protein Sradi_7029600 [Sesamum radiatum]|uniref:Uncharacterized protein n=1 Tax=Sesamum radiatum TaxID=300843 RepID=A0AAW2JCN4_SESRA